MSVDAGNNFEFIYKKYKDDSKDELTFTAQWADSKFMGQWGFIDCKFVATKSMEQDFHFIFTLSTASSISSYELLTSYQESHVNNNEKDNYHLPNELMSFQIQSKVLGYISEEGMWQIYIGEKSYKTNAVDNNDALVEFEKTADRHGIGCSNNAFQGKIASACARVILTDEGTFSH